jgi:signal peptidase I
MLYLGKGRSALIYFGVLCAAIAVKYIQLDSVDADVLSGISSFAALMVGCFHSYRVAGGLTGNTPVFWFSRWYFLTILCSFPFLLLLFRIFAFDIFGAASGSMAPSLMRGDVFTVSKIAYGYSRFSFPFGWPAISGRVFAARPELGDVVVFRLPIDTRTDYVKRIVAGPGDRVRMSGGRLHLNGVVVNRTDAGTLSLASNSGFEVKSRYRCYVEVLPNGSAYSIAEETDTGPLDDTREYLIPQRHYFVLGDNRDASQDSRILPTVGFIPEENIVGRVSLVFWNSEMRTLSFRRVQRSVENCQDKD